MSPPSKLVSFKGQTRTVAEWASLLGLTKSALFQRLASWPVEEALRRPLRNNHADRNGEREFMRNVEKQGERGCWFWIGAVFTDGYGVFHYKKKTRRAHRVAWLLFRGEISDDLQVLHRCDNPRCVRPSHLFLGTEADNREDKMRKGRQARKLLPSQVREVRALLSRGVPQKTIAAQFSVSYPTIRAIRIGRTHRT